MLQAPWIPKLRAAPPEPDPPGTASSEEYARICALAVAGSCAAGIAAVVACRLPEARNLTWDGLLFRCVAYYAITAGCGAAVTAAAWWMLGAKPSVSRGRILLHCLIGWIFLPPIILLDRASPAWALPPLAVAAAALAVSLRQLAPGALAEEAGWSVPLRNFPGFEEIRITGFRPLRALCIALCAQAALISAIVHVWLLSGMFLAAGVFLLFWHWCADSQVTIGRRMRSRWTRSAVAAGFLICLLVLLPWLARHGGGAVAAVRPAVVPARATTPVPAHFTSVILYPPLRRVTELYFPSPHRAQQFATTLNRPLEIPFDGPYWYFEPPDQEPGDTAHIAHGLPTEHGINLSSADGGPLRMEAIQRLAKPIDANCCAEFDVSLVDADTQGGALDLGVLLTDNSSAQRPTLLLGFRTVGSGAAPLAGAGPAVAPRETTDTVRFPIPSARPLRRFNQITVVVLPTLDRSRGAKIAIQGFTLQPK